MSPIRIINDEASLGNFLLYFPDGRAAEWNGNIKDRWGTTKKESSSWDTNPVPISERDRIIILDIFGLLAWGGEFPLTIHKRSSPKALIEARRKIEKREGLRRVNVYRDGCSNQEDFAAEKFG